MKKNKLTEIDFYMVTDSGLSKNGMLSDVENAIRAGCKIIQYREKSKCTKEMIEEAEEIKRLCRGKAVFLVNDRVDVTLAVDADGVHIGQDDMPFETVRRLLGEEKIIGLTVHNVEESVGAESVGADYIGLSPIFETSTKEDAGSGCGIFMIEKVRKSVKLPIVAIGGLNKGNIGDVIKAGADSAVAISAVICKDDTYKEIISMIKIIKESKKNRRCNNKCQEKSLKFCNF